jgi:hypothetical protein
MFSVQLVLRKATLPTQTFVLVIVYVSTGNTSRYFCITHMDFGLIEWFRNIFLFTEPPLFSLLLVHNRNGFLVCYCIPTSQ